MEKFIPYEKLSKKEKRKLDLAKRQTWGELNPVTRKPENSKAYNRKRTQDWKKELPDPASFFLYGCCQTMKGQNEPDFPVICLENFHIVGKLNRSAEPLTVTKLQSISLHTNTAHAVKRLVHGD